MVLVLLVGVVVLTAPLWGPGVVEKLASAALRHAGVSEVALQVQSLGLEQSKLKVERLHFEGATLSNADLAIDYSAAGLWQGKLGRMAIYHPQLEVVLPRATGTGEKASEAGSGLEPLEFPANFPLPELEIVDARVTLRDGTTRHLVEFNARLRAEAGGVLSLNMEIPGISLALEGVQFASERLELFARGSATDALAVTVRVAGGQITWAEGSGQLTGLEGAVEFSAVLPPVTAGRQRLEFTSFQQGDFTAGAGTIELRYAAEPGAGTPLAVEVNTTALGGAVRLVVEGAVREPRALMIRVLLDAVEMEALAALFPQFEGEITGTASGELALRLEGQRIILLPGGIQLDTGSSGRFKYTRQGWLTQDAGLDPEAFVAGRDIVEIMQDPQGATALTELALRELMMSEFSLNVREARAGEPTFEARIEGERMIQGVRVPVILDVPIRGDVEETLNAVFKFNARM